jgi:hypothetical protein
VTGGVTGGVTGRHDRAAIFAQPSTDLLQNGVILGILAQFALS